MLLLQKSQESRPDFLNLDFGIKNFKSFKERQFLNIKPLTVICGANNSGKSSIIQSLLLLTQSYKSYEPIHRYRPWIYWKRRVNYQNSLLFEGDLCHLSGYTNVINDYSKYGKLNFIFQNNQKVYDISFFNEKNNQGVQGLVERINLKDRFYNISLIAELNSEGNISHYKFHGHNINLYKLLDLSDFARSRIFYNFRRKIKKAREKLVNINLKNVNIGEVQVIFYGFFPHKIVFPLKWFIQELENHRGDFDIITEILKFLTQDFESRKRKPRDIRMSLTREFDYIMDFLEHLRYIGPLRDDPHRYYQFYDTRNLDIGRKGEYAAQILTLQKDKEIHPFKIINFQSNNRVEKYDDITLNKALKIWSEKSDLPYLEPRHIEETLFKVMVELLGDQKKVSIQDVGFGISQVLPVYIEALRMDKDSTLILEQPEIHLHPNMQSNLGDFLLNMAFSDRNFIIETHSEYLINRLCLRVAQDKSNKLGDLVSIVFVKSPKIRGGKYFGSNVEKIKLNKYGDIENWPIGFFDKSDHRKILKAGIEKRKKENEREKND